MNSKNQLQKFKFQQSLQEDGFDAKSSSNLSNAEQKKRRNIDLADGGKKKRRKKLTFLLTHTKSLEQLINESNIAKATHPTYLTALAKPSIYPTILFCQICGNFAKYKCKVCFEEYCSIVCNHVHKETKCIVKF